MYVCADGRLTSRLSRNPGNFPRCRRWIAASQLGSSNRGKRERRPFRQVSLAVTPALFGGLRIFKSAVSPTPRPAIISAYASPFPVFSLLSWRTQARLIDRRRNSNDAGLVVCAVACDGGNVCFIFFQISFISSGLSLTMRGQGDERKPNCQNCIDKNLVCQYGLQVSFLEKNTFTVSAQELRTPRKDVGYGKIQVNYRMAFLELKLIAQPSS